MSPALPFNAKMDADDFMKMAQALRDDGRTLEDTYRAAETMHETFCRQPRYGSFETFKKEYYRRHPSRR